jgi:hypothetical protein
MWWSSAASCGPAVDDDRSRTMSSDVRPLFAESCREVLQRLEHDRSPLASALRAEANAFLSTFEE